MVKEKNCTKASICMSLKIDLESGNGGKGVAGKNGTGGKGGDSRYQATIK